MPSRYPVIQQLFAELRAIREGHDRGEVDERGNPTAAGRLIAAGAKPVKPEEDRQ